MLNIEPTEESPSPDCYEFHLNKPNPFCTYAQVDEIIDDQLDLAAETIGTEQDILEEEIGRTMLEYESRAEFNKSQKDMRDRLEFLTH